DAPSRQSQARALDAARAIDAALRLTDAAAAAPPSLQPPPAPAEAACPVIEPASASAPASASEPRRAEAAVASSVETVRLSAQRLEGLLRDSEEMLPEKLASRQISAQLHEAIAGFAEWRREWSKLQSGSGRSAEQAAPGTGLRAFLGWNERLMLELEARLADLAKTADAEAHRLGLKTDRLLAEVK